MVSLIRSKTTHRAGDNRLKDVRRLHLDLSSKAALHGAFSLHVELALDHLEDVELLQLHLVKQLLICSELRRPS